MAWISPTGHNGTDPMWINPEYAHDDDLETCASCGAYEKWLVLTHVALDCDKVRVWPSNKYSIRVDAYYDGVWNRIFSGETIGGTWKEIGIGAVKSVTALRIALTGSTGTRICEFDFWEVEVAAPTVTTQDATDIGFD